MPTCTTCEREFDLISPPGTEPYAGHRCDPAPVARVTERPDLISWIIAYENGELSADDCIDLFATLVATGDAWHLQGHYGRTAAALIEQGYLTASGEVLRYSDEEDY